MVGKKIPCTHNNEPELSQGAIGEQAAACVSSGAESARDSSWYLGQHLAGMWGHVEVRALGTHRGCTQAGSSMVISLLSVMHTELASFSSISQTLVLVIFLFTMAKHLNGTT